MSSSGVASSTKSSSYERAASARSSRAESSTTVPAFRKTGTTTEICGMPSVTGMCVDDMEERLVGGEPAEILDEQRCPSVRRPLGAPRDGRREEERAEERR